MQQATPEAVAAFLRRDKEALLTAWEAKAKRLPKAAGVPQTLLRNELPHLIDELIEELLREGSALPRVLAFSASHGAQRQKIGLHLSDVVEEYKLLRDTILERAQAERLTVTGKANRAVNGLIDAGVKTAIQAHIAQRDEAEKRRREEYLKFIVHDLRSPLAAIYYAIILAEKELAQAPVNERVRSIHAAIKRNIERMRGLIVKLLQEEENLKTPRQVELKRETVDLWPLVESAARTLGSLAVASETQLVNQVPRDLTAQADPELLERVFQNLLANAIEHTPKGQVTVGARAAPEGGVECWVADNGHGVSPELQRTVFEKQVAEPEGRGAGLGLAIVKRLVEAHGGTIDLESRTGAGTTVRFSLPAR